MKRFLFAISFAVLVILTMNFRCSKDVVQPFQYEFTASVDIYPLKKSYTRNDTVWIETDLPTKFLFDSKSGQNINADSTQIILRATYNEFGTSIHNPPNGFCEIISSNGNTVLRSESPWATGGDLQYGCGQPSFKCRIGFKPNYRGTYGLILSKNDLLTNCPLKVKWLYANLVLRYKNVDLNQDVFNQLPISDKGGNGGASFYTNMINTREMFVIKVE